MKLFLVVCFLLVTCNGCRISLTAEKLALYVQADEPSYLSAEDPALYDPGTKDAPDPVD